MTKHLGHFFAAIRFFTRLPVPAWVEHSQEQLTHAARWLPAVGIVVGLIGVIVTELMALILPPTTAILLGMMATILATGAFHEDGLADCCDGFGGGWEQAQVLQIMKDSRVGSYATVGVGVILLLKWNLLTGIDQTGGPLGLTAAIIAAHAVSRLAAVALMHTLDYVGENSDSKSKPLTQGLNWQDLTLASTAALLPCLFLPLGDVLTALAVVGVTTFLAARYFIKRIGGYTGDCLGATQQTTEVAFYLGILCSFT